MNENSSKQVLLSILGIAVLVVAVVGVSFAFFTYSRAGTTNNVITTGAIYLNYDETQAISLTNQFPMTDAEAKTEILKGTESDVADMTFSVTGYDSSTKGIDYTVYLVPGDATGADGKTRMKDSDVSVFMSIQNTSTTVASSFVNNIEEPTVVSTLDGYTGAGAVIATGKINGGTTTATQQTHAFTLNMFVNNSVTISDTDASADYRASSTDVGDVPVDADGNETTDTRDVYSDMYYSVKVNVEGNTSTTTGA